MPSLIRRRSNDIPQNSWRIFYGDVPVGWIGIRSGGRLTLLNWAGVAASILAWSRDSIATDRPLHSKGRGQLFLFAWRQVLPHLGEANFEAYRREHAFHKWRHRMWSEGLKMPTQLASGRSKCFCGAAINLKNTEQHVYKKHMDLK